MIEIEPESIQGLLRRTTPIPVEFQQAFERAAHAQRLDLPGVRLALVLDNSLAMASRVSAMPGELQIVFDWALIERTLMFSRVFWVFLGTRLCRQHLASYLEQEIFLLAARKAALANRFVAAREYHRRYVKFRFRDLWTHEIDFVPQSQAAVWHGLFMLYAELGMLALRGDPGLAERHFRDIEALQRGHIRYDERASRELYCDSYALDAITRRDETAAGRGLGIEVALVIAYLEIVQAVDGLSEGFDGWAAPFGDMIDAELARDHRYRVGQLESLLRQASRQCDDPDFRAAFLDCATIARELGELVEQVLSHGLTMLHDYEWPDRDQVRASRRDQSNGLPRRAIFEIVDEIAGFVDGAAVALDVHWGEGGPPTAIDELIPDIVTAPGRPQSEGWRERLCSPLLGAALRGGDNHTAADDG